MIVKFGNQEISTRDRYHKNTINPQFHESFEFITELPGISNVTIEVWDRDGGNVSPNAIANLTDDFIGSTIIDIENRNLKNVNSGLLHGTYKYAYICVCVCVCACVCEETTPVRVCEMTYRKICKTFVNKLSYNMCNLRRETSDTRACGKAPNL